jgi:hypothetical protein
MKVRSFMMIMELIINRLSSVESDLFFRIWTIDKVEEIEANTYLRLYVNDGTLILTAFAFA